MALFKPAENTTAYLKMALMGFQGSGKTYTGTDTAIGLVQLMRKLKLPMGDKPIFFLDTEKGSDWIKPQVEAAGIGLFTAKTRAFTALLEAVPEAEANGSVMLIDSLTHFWVELTETYCAMKAREYKRASYRLQFQDWAFLKAEWRKFTDRFVNSSVHIIACGRAGFEYDYNEDENGKKQLEKTGVKMKAEGEMGYEPDLLVLMERRMDMETKTDQHIAHVVKDRSTLLDGKEFAEPTFKCFLPHIQRLNLGGRQLGVDTSLTSAKLIPADARDNRTIQRKIALDEIESLLVYHIPGQAAADKKRKLELLRTHFNASWTEMSEVMSLERLRQGYDTLHHTLEGTHSRYHQEAPEEPARDINDDLPEHSAPPAAAVKPPIDTTDVNGIPRFLKRERQEALPLEESPWIVLATR